MTPASREPTAAVAFLALLDTTRRREGGMVMVCGYLLSVCTVVKCQHSVPDMGHNQ